MIGGRVLLVEDDPAIAMVTRAALEEEGLTVDCCASVSDRDLLLSDHRYDAMLTDVVLEDGDGIEALASVRADYPQLPIIIVSAQNTLDTAVRATGTGAFEYFPKPFDLDELTRAVCQAVGSGTGAADVADQTESALPLVGRSQAMQGVYRMITRVLANDLTVLVLGESGTGKELVAEAIHELGHRKQGPFVAINAAAIPRELIESELFGHERGAFTGAIARSVGKFEQAHGGTLFLDEIGDMPMEAQTRLLRALQSGSIRRLGGREEVSINVRIVAATNRDLTASVAKGKFREDLFYRLNVVPIELPPLRKRSDDVGALARHFLQVAAAEGLPRRSLSAPAIAMLAAQPWRGNVRELKNFMFRLSLMARDDVIEAAAVSDLLGEAPPSSTRAAEVDFPAAVDTWLEHAGEREGGVYHDALTAFEKPLFIKVLQRTKGNQLRAAQILGINRNTLRKRLVDLDIDPANYVRTAVYGTDPAR